MRGLRRGCTTVLGCALLLCTACQPSAPVQNFAGLAQGSSYRVSFHAGDNDIDSGLLQRDIEAELHEIDRLMSNYRDDSVIEQFNRQQNTTSFALGAEIVALLRQADLVAAASNGCYDPGIAPLWRLWGFADDRLQVPDAAAIAAARAASSIRMIDIVDERHVRKQSATVALDLSSIAQGYTARRMAAVLEQDGIVNYIAEIGGEMVLRGARADGNPWQVAIQHPASSKDKVPWQRSVRSASEQQLAIATSGSYRHFLTADGQRYSHIIDARSGRPVQHATVSVTVQHSDAALADAWSTALLCLGRGQGMMLAEDYAIGALFIEQLADGDRRADDTQARVRYRESVTAAWRDDWRD